MNDLVRQAKDYLAMNAAESGADVLIRELIRANEGLTNELFYAYHCVEDGFKRGVFDFSVLRACAKQFLETQEPCNLQRQALENIKSLGRTPRAGEHEAGLHGIIRAMTECAEGAL